MPSPSIPLSSSSSARHDTVFSPSHPSAASDPLKATTSAYAAGAGHEERRLRCFSADTPHGILLQYYQGWDMYTTWYSRGDSGMHHHQMGQLYHHGPPMIKTEAGVNSDCMMAVDYAPPIKPLDQGSGKKPPARIQTIEKSSIVRDTFGINPNRSASELVIGRVPFTFHRLNHDIEFTFLEM
ncbi:hypothetical protein MSG28_011558 [Choristoneura fumiferana]|uniref:Uncharacterized protein n=1 Tax=Choristoneura fumiferana TaxID=7141 RepID=A0ACC0JNU1_CHOFU|nr:hypothetical protein MSG28_011558 [Choristoneura fumiferana]